MCTEWWRAYTATLHVRKQEIEVLKRRLDAEQYAILAESNSRGVRGCTGHSTLMGVDFQDFTVSEKEASARADRALALHPGVVIGGDVVPPLTAEAAAEDAIGDGQIGAIIGALAQVPSFVPEDDVRAEEKILVDLARRAGLKEIMKAGRRMLKMMDPDGKEPRDEGPKDARPELRFIKHRDGTLGFAGTLDLETYARLKSDLDPPAKSHKAVDSVRDSCSKGERYGDRLIHKSEWKVRIALDGLPEFIAPAYLDPTGKKHHAPTGIGRTIWPRSASENAASCASVWGRTVNRVRPRCAARRPGCTAGPCALD
ncbi:DUF222 domain-containing protein [Amycolatopsis coloradensis]|uniref:DUF222 domain-containing protein n=1 Tax=Amycolatopsis coloradensis TaxID=76021 RepID=UPI002447A7FB|nr:DUF222 domain-containing protein [Amycolatopsis coloradensis]